MILNYNKTVLITILILALSACTTIKLSNDVFITNESSNVANGSTLTTDGEKIYYVDYSGNCQLYSIRLDGTEKRMIAENSFIDIFYYNNYIYFTERVQDNVKTLFSRMRTDGTDYEVLLDGYES